MQSILEDHILLEQEVVDDVIKISIRNTSRWAVFIAISCTIVNLVLFILLYYTFTRVASIRRLDNNYSIKTGLTLAGIFCIISGYLSVMIIFAVKFIKAIKTNSQQMFEKALVLFKAWLILTVCFMLVYIFLFVMIFLNKF